MIKLPGELQDEEQSYWFHPTVLLCSKSPLPISDIDGLLADTTLTLLMWKFFWKLSCTLKTRVAVFEDAVTLYCSSAHLDGTLFLSYVMKGFGSEPQLDVVYVKDGAVDVIAPVATAKKYFSDNLSHFLTWCHCARYHRWWSQIHVRLGLHRVVRAADNLHVRSHTLVSGVAIRVRVSYVSDGEN